MQSNVFQECESSNDIDISVELLLLMSRSPMSLDSLLSAIGSGVSGCEISASIDRLKERWRGRGLVLCETATGWSFQTKLEYRDLVSNVVSCVPKYSRAVMEVLTVIAYRQPVTCGDIEEIRGVSTSPAIIRTLEDRGWIEVAGQKPVPGNPVLYRTTKCFLDDLSLKSIEDLPSLQECSLGIVNDISSKTQV